MLLRCAVYSMYCTVRYVLNHGAALCYIPWLSNSPFSVNLRGWKRKVSSSLPIRLWTLKRECVVPSGEATRAELYRENKQPQAEVCTTVFMCCQQYYKCGGKEHWKVGERDRNPHCSHKISKRPSLTTLWIPCTSHILVIISSSRTHQYRRQVLCCFNL